MLIIRVGIRNSGVWHLDFLILCHLKPISLPRRSFVSPTKTPVWEARNPCHRKIVIVSHIRITYFVFALDWEIRAQSLHFPVDHTCHVWLILHTKWTIEKRISLALNGLKNSSSPFIVLFLFAIKHRMFLWTGVRFLKGLVTFWAQRQILKS